MRLSKYLSFALIILSAQSIVHASAVDDGLGYINSLRQSAGLIGFSSNGNLNNAAQNHSKYLDTNHAFGHTEDSSNSDFTGERPWDRTEKAGYLSIYSIGENVSVGQPDINSSIDSLFSAI